MDFSTYVFSAPYSSWLLKGGLYTLVIASSTILISLFLGLQVCFLNISKLKTLKSIGRLYVIIFRNVPPVPLLLFLTFGLPGIYHSLTGLIFPRNTTFALLIIGISLNSSAYIAEIIRSGLNAVPIENINSAKTLGLSSNTIKYRILLPQALDICMPALGTRIIHNIKNSAIAIVLPLNVNNMEIMGQAGRIAGQTFAWAEPLIISAGFYLFLTLLVRLAINMYLKTIKIRYTN